MAEREKGLTKLDIGIVSDEISRDLGEALEIAGGWDIHTFELREGGRGRFPAFTAEEISIVDHAMQAGARISAVSPGIFKGHVAEEGDRRREIESVFPKAIELAQRFACETIIAFSFDHCDDSPAHRLLVLRAFEQIAEMAAQANVLVAFENEPQFWIDRPEKTVALLEEIGHPALRINWDPANLHWSGQKPDKEAFEILKPYLINLHVKDFTPEDEEVPWRPLGDGIVPWKTLLPVIAQSGIFQHLTVETHCEPLIENSARSIDHLRNLLEKMDVED